MLKKGRISVEEIPAFFPELTSDDIEEIAFLRSKGGTGATISKPTSQGGQRPVCKRRSISDEK